ncbi:glycine oxidase ThiO [Flindersiella endophytica]
MTTSISGSTVAVVGAGVIGLSVAWRAATAGHHVTLIDPAPASGASWVAGGMLAPVSEAWHGEEDLLALGVAALEHWPGFAEQLREVTGTEPGLRTDGTIVVAVDSADLTQLDELAGHLGKLGHHADHKTSRELRSLEPTLGPAVRGGLWLPHDLSVDNRALLATLRQACAKTGVELRETAAHTVSAGRVDLADSTTIHCGQSVIAAGAWSGQLHPALAERVRPVKGEILRLRARRGSLPPPVTTVRGTVEGRPVYFVPRGDGEVVLGATQYEAGFETGVRVSGVRDLLRDGERVLPGISEYALVESNAGLRPGSPDNLPIVERLEPGLVAATGHFRNGFLLAPITAEKVLELLS